MSKTELVLVGIVVLGIGVVVMFAVGFLFYRPNRTLSRKNLFLSAILGIIAMFIAMQLAPFVVPSLQPTNPDVTYNVNWDSPQTKALWDRACADCHSNETVWPWYTHVAPISWLVIHDVDEGRQKVNVSTGHNIEWDEMNEQIERGTMPKPIYITMHPNAQLTDAEKDQLMTGLRATFGRGGTNSTQPQSNNGSTTGQTDTDDD